MKISIIGLGYVGLPLACAVAKNKSYKVVGFDLDKNKIKAIKKKQCPIDDQTCAEDLQKVIFEVSTNDKILKDSCIFIICVPTPVFDDYTPDYGPVESATITISKYLKKGNIVILESTVNPGTCEEIVLPILEKGSKLEGGKDFILAHCPERINPGDNKWNVYNIPRNVGALTKTGAKKIVRFYESFLEAKINTVSTTKVAEATKIVENTFRDVNIAFVNELAKSFDTLGIDLYETLKGASNKPFAFMAHWPGCGVGGHCIAVDPYYLIKRATLSGFNHRFLKAAREINNSMPKYTVRKLVEALNEIKKPLNGTKVALLGLSYKANVGDLRESPSFEVLKELKKRKAIVNTYDPYVLEKNTYPTLDETLGKSEAVVLCTAHKEFLLDPVKFKNKGIKTIVDGRNCLDKEKVESLDIIYKGIGR